MPDLVTTIGLDDKQFRRDLSRADKDVGRSIGGLGSGASRALGLGAIGAVGVIAFKKLAAEIRETAEQASKYDDALGRIDGSGKRFARSLDYITFSSMRLEEGLASLFGGAIDTLAQRFDDLTRDLKFSGLFGEGAKRSIVNEGRDLVGTMERELQRELDIVSGATTRERLQIEDEHARRTEEIKKLDKISTIRDGDIAELNRKNDELREARLNKDEPKLSPTVFRTIGTGITDRATVNQAFGRGSTDSIVLQQLEIQRQQLEIQRQQLAETKRKQMGYAK